MADFVQSPETPRQYGGEGSPSKSLYSLADDADYNADQAVSMENVIETAGESVGEYPNPWLRAANVAINTVGAYLAYKAQGLWFHWLSNEWGHAVAGASHGCVAATGADTGNCQLWRISKGTQLCIGYTPSTQTAVTWTAPSDGLLLAGDTTNLYTSAFSGPCYGYNWNPVSVPSGNTTEINAVNSSAGSAFEMDSGLRYTVGQDFMIWFQPISGTWAGGAHPAGFWNDDVEAYSSQPIPTGDLSRYVGTPTVGQIANALRQQLTDPSDTCNGAPCAWGDNGGSPGASQTHHNSWTMSCLISGTCASTSLNATFSMPDCYTLTYDACDLKMQTLGFTGTLEADTAADADYSMPAGDIVGTSPIATTAVSTVASTIATAHENPQSCKWQVQDPHPSSGTPDAVDVKATATCTYATTIHATLNLWKCDSPPQPDLVGIEQGDWGCIYVAEAADGTRTTAPDVPETFQAPDDDGETLISGDNKYFIAYGTLDQGSPPSAWSNVAQIP